MEENMEILNPEQPRDTRVLIVKWLKFLLTVQMTSWAVSVLSTLFMSLSGGVLIQLTGVAGKVLTLCVMAALFKLSSVNVRYRIAFIALLISAIGTIAESLIIAPNLMLVISLVSFAGSIAGLVAVYQEYHGHIEVASDAGDSELSRKWCSLFVWQVVIGVVISLISISVSVLGVAADADLEKLVRLLVPVISIPGFILEAIYIYYLKKTLALYE